MVVGSDSRRAFDRYVMVDWSANSTPKRGRDSIWIAEAAAVGHVTLTNPSTRSAALAELRTIISRAEDERLLVGFDFSFGYPQGFASSVVGEGAGWSEVWSRFGVVITDGDDNANNRFEVAAELNGSLDGGGPFWGHPGREAPVGRQRPPQGQLDEFRLTERRVIEAGHRPFSAWQLAYPGSVGSQMMLGIARLDGLRRDPVLGRRCRVWPFETGFGEDGLRVEPGGVVLAEIWPSMFSITSDHLVRDAAQVESVVDLIRGLDGLGGLHAWAAPVLDADDREIVLREEGWTFGVL